VAVRITGAGPGDTALDLSFVAHDPAFIGGAPVAVESSKPRHDAVSPSTEKVRAEERFLDKEMVGDVYR